MDTRPAKTKSLRQRIADFLWEDRADRPRWLEWIVAELRVFYFVFRGFRQHQCPLRASALTFVTLLSIVPVLALGISMVKGLGIDTSLITRYRPPPRQEVPLSGRMTTGSLTAEPSAESATSGSQALAVESATTKTAVVAGSEKPFFVQIRDAFTAQLTADQTQVWNQIIDYVQKTDFSTLKAVGILFLIFTAIAALGTMEAVFNEIWHVHRSRPLLRKFADYLSVIVICPILIAAAIAMTATVSSHSLIERLSGSGFLNSAMARVFSLAPYASLWLALALLYLFLPNTRVRLRHALTGGFVAGVIWQLAFWGYTTFQIGFSRYNAIYSTFAALPIFLTWLYVSWLIVLFGAEVAAAYQNRKVYEHDQMMPKISAAERLRLGLNLVLAICSRFQAERSPWTAEQLSQYLECPSGQVDDILAALIQTGILVPSANGEPATYLPAVPLSKLSPARVIEALQESESAGSVGNATPESICARTLMEKWREGLWRELGDVGFDRLVESFQASPSMTAPASLKSVDTR